MTRLLIIGAGGHGKVAADTAEECGYSDIVFLDQSWPERKGMNGRWPIVGKPEKQDADTFCAVGHNQTRARLFGTLELTDSPILVHSSATLSPTAVLGVGSLAVAGSIVNADSRVGRGVILNTGCSVDHDCEIGDFVHISPGARIAGGVSVGAGSWIGIGAVVCEGVRIGENVMVAAGAAVINDIEDKGRVGGVPAKNI